MGMLDFIEWMDTLGLGTRNVLRGEFEGAARAGADFLTGPLRAVLPEQALPKLVRPEDRVTTPDFLGIDEPGFARSASSFVGDTLLDPLTWVGLSPSFRRKLKQAYRSAGDATDAVPGVGSAKSWLRRATTNEKLSPEVADLVRRGEEPRQKINQDLEAVLRLQLGKYPPDIQEAVFDSVENIYGTGANARQLVQRATEDGSYVTRDRNLRRATEVAEQHPLVQQNPERLPELHEAVRAYVETFENIHQRLVEQQVARPARGIPGAEVSERFADQFLTSDDIRRERDRVVGAETRAQRALNERMRALGVDPLVTDELAALGEQRTLLREARDEAQDALVSAGVWVPEGGRRPDPSKLEPIIEALDDDDLRDVLREYRQATDALDALPSSSNRRQELIDQLGAEELAPLRSDLERAQEGVRQYREEFNNVRSRFRNVDLNQFARTSYMPRVFDGPTRYDPKVARRLNEAGSLLDFIQENPDVGLQRRADRAFGEYIGRIGEDVGRAPVMKWAAERGTRDRERRRLQSLQEEGSLANDPLYRRAVLENERYKNPVPAYASPEVQDRSKKARAEALNAARAAMARGELPRSVEEVADAAAINAAHRAHAWSASGRSSTTDLLEEMQKAGDLTADEAGVLRDMVRPEVTPSKLLRTLQKWNSPFKKAAVYGVLVPRIAGMWINRLTGVVQPLGRETTSARQLAGNARRAIPDVAGAFADAYFPDRKRMRDWFSDSMQAVDEAYRVGGSDPERVAQYLRETAKDPLLAEAVDLGVLGQGFVHSEQILNDLRNTAPDAGFRGKFRSAWEAPQRAFQSTEQRLRLGMFLDKMRERLPKHASPAQMRAEASRAAAEVLDEVYNYQSRSAANRWARELFPFVQFTFQAVPREFEKMLTVPAYGAAMSRLFGNRDPQEEGVPEWMQSRSGFGLGDTEDGRRQRWVRGIPSPTEALVDLPWLGNSLGETGDELLTGVLGRLAPIPKAGLAWATNRDPFTGSEFGQYARNPFTGESDEFGRAYRILSSTGLIQPVTTAVQSTVEPFVQQNPAAAALRVLTGGRIADYDPEYTRQKNLENALDRDLNARAFKVYYSPDWAQNEETDALIEELNQMRRQAKQQAEVQ